MQKTCEQWNGFLGRWLSWQGSSTSAEGLLHTMKMLPWCRVRIAKKMVTDGTCDGIGSGVKVWNQEEEKMDLWNAFADDGVCVLGLDSGG